MLDGQAFTSCLTVVDIGRYLHPSLIMLFTLLANPLFGAESTVPQCSSDSRALPRLCGHPPSLFTLFAEPVQKELLLSAGQVNRIKELGTSYAECTHPLRRRLRELRAASDEVGAETLASECSELIRALNAESRRHEGLSRQILSDHQEGRLKQLTRWARGAWLFFDPLIQNGLELTPSQVSRIKELVKHGESQRRILAEQTRGKALSPCVTASKTKEVRENTRRAVRGELTSEQIGRLDKLLGPEPSYEPTEVRYRLITRGKQ
jgi:hypothetical protein